MTVKSTTRRATAAPPVGIPARSSEPGSGTSPVYTIVASHCGESCGDPGQHGAEEPLADKNKSKRDHQAARRTAAPMNTKSAR